MRTRALATRASLAGVVALALVVGFAGAASAASWHFGTVDGTSTTKGRVASDVGQYSTTILYHGKPNTFYRNVEDGSLRRSWWDGEAWRYEIVDGPGGSLRGVSHDVGADARALVFADQAHVFYYDVTTGDLRHAWFTEKHGWSFEVLDGDGAPGHLSGDVGTDISVLNFGAGPQAFYYDITRRNLRQAFWDGSRWSYRTLDGNSNSRGRTGNDVGQYTSTTLFATGPHVFYYDDTATVLRRAWWTGARWRYEVVDGVGGPAGRVNESVGSDSATTVSQGMLQVWYYGIDSGNLRHAILSPWGWLFQTLDGDGGAAGRQNADVGMYVSVIPYGNALHVFYRDETESALRHAYAVGFSWAFETLDGSGDDDGSASISGGDGDVGTDTSTYVYGGRLNALSYDDDVGALRRASIKQ